MQKVYAGTSGWAYSSWKPNFYPAKLSSAKFLTYYATRLNSVEVNYTFQTFPSEKLLRGWMDATPEGFKFTVKAHRKITHVKRLRDAAEIAAEFISALKPLEKAGRLGPVLFQLPPNLKCNVELLKHFLGGLSSGARVAFEFRDASWFVEDVFTALQKKNAALCFAESDDLETPNVQTADFFYLRFRKSDYSKKSCWGLAKAIADLTRQREVFAYFKHEETPECALRAEALLAKINPG